MENTVTAKPFLCFTVTVFTYQLSAYMTSYRRNHVRWAHLAMTVCTRRIGTWKILEFLKLFKHTIRCHPNRLNLARKPKYLSKLK